MTKIAVGTRYYSKGLEVDDTFCRAGCLLGSLILKLSCVLESPGGHIKTQLLGHTSKFLIWCVFKGPEKLHFYPCSQMMQIWSGNHWLKAINKKITKE